MKCKNISTCVILIQESLKLFSITKSLSNMTQLLVISVTIMKYTLLDRVVFLFMFSSSVCEVFFFAVWLNRMLSSRNTNIIKCNAGLFYHTEQITNFPYFYLSINLFMPMKVHTG